MKVVIPGGTGQVGQVLVRAFRNEGHEVAVLSRRPRPSSCRMVEWDAETLGPWTREFEGADAVINLTGQSVNCRYSARNRRIIKQSRLKSTRVVGEAIAQASSPPRVWLQASTATIYAHRYDAPNDEATGVLGRTDDEVPDTWRFSIDVATSWERAANEAIVPHTRKVLLRLAILMSADRGGTFDLLLSLVRRGLGGRHGDGRQYVSWIHERDFFRAVAWLIDRDDLAGAVNLAAPHPLSDAEFMRALRAEWGTRVGLPAPRWLLEIGTFFMRTESELVLKSRRVVPSCLLESGFAFDFPTWTEAAGDLCRRWRKGHGAV